MLREWRDGDPSAATRLTPLVYTELRALARRRLSGQERNAISATELVHEAFLRMVKQDQPEYVNRAHFYSIAARLMRQILVDFSRHSRASKRGSGAPALSLEAAENVSSSAGPGVIAIHDALNQLALMDQRKSRMLEMRYFGGMTAEEIAEVEGVASATVTREIRAATAWLRANVAGAS